jgi:hypothetical protein
LRSQKLHFRREYRILVGIWLYGIKSTASTFNIIRSCRRPPVSLDGLPTSITTKPTKLITPYCRA